MLFLMQHLAAVDAEPDRHAAMQQQPSNFQPATWNAKSSDIQIAQTKYHCHKAAGKKDAQASQADGSSTRNLAMHGNAGAAENPPLSSSGMY